MTEKTRLSAGVPTAVLHSKASPGVTKRKILKLGFFDGETLLEPVVSIVAVQKKQHKNRIMNLIHQASD